jgi:hypothetical protein
MAKLSELDSSLKEIVSETAADLFEKRYPNVLAMFDANPVYSAIASYIRIEGLPEAVKDDFTPNTVVKFTEKAFLELLRRNALDQFVRIKFDTGLPPEVEKELDAMEISAGYKQAPPKVDPKAAQNAAIDQCVADYRSMDGAHFKMKYMNIPSQRAIFDQAIAAGKI